MPQISIRKATMEDADLLLEWRNDPDTVRHSTSNSGVEKKEHYSWLEARLGSKESVLLIGTDGAGGDPLGMVRFDATEDCFWTVSINLAPVWRGKKLSSSLLNAAVEHFADAHTAILAAHVKPDNDSSRKCFERSGFALYEERDGQLVYLNKVLVINAIEAARHRNNVNWMNLMRLAFRVAPHEAEEIFRSVNEDDGTIADLVNTLTKKMPN